MFDISNFVVVLIATILCTGLTWTFLIAMAWPANEEKAARNAKNIETNDKRNNMMSKTLLSYISRSKRIESSKITKVAFDYIYVIVSAKRYYTVYRKLYIFGEIGDTLFLLSDGSTDIDFTDIPSLSFDVDPSGVIRYYNRTGKIKCTVPFSSTCTFSEADDTEKAYIKWVLNDNSPNSIVAVKGSGMDIIIGLQTIYDSIIKQVRENMGDSIDKIEEEVLKLFLENHENEQNE